MSSKRFAVFGNPIKQSRSPLIHSAFGQQCGIKLEYRAVRVEVDDFERAATAFFEGGGSGLNVTVPFKERASALAENLMPRAQRAMAANTLFLDETGTLCADNTDGVGLVRDMVAAGRLRATIDFAEAIHATDLSFVCVGTPSAPDERTLLVKPG